MLRPGAAARGTVFLRRNAKNAATGRSLGWLEECFTRRRVSAHVRCPTGRLRRLAAGALAVALAALSGALGLPAVARAAGAVASIPERRVTTAQFEGALARHGRWLRLRDGARGWQPGRVRHDWQPYRDGHWSWTDAGWFWVSEEPWAWATYHHGLWRFDTSAGWVWLPSGEWAPSRVVWRYTAGAIGWAPLTDDGLLLPVHWTFLPEARFAGTHASAGIAPSRAAALFATSRRAPGGEGPRPSAGSAAVIVPARFAAADREPRPVPGTAPGAAPAATAAQ
jgi:hypothetical protein